MFLNRSVLVLMLLLAVAFSIHVVSPAIMDAQENAVLDLGTIGPGQTVDILIDRQVTTGGIHGEGGLYDYAIGEELPRGWTAKQSKLYQDPLQITVTADPNAHEGSYSFRIIAVDENNGEQLGNVTLIGKVRITYDIMDFDVTPKHITTGPGQPGKFSITLTNKGSTSDVFQISSSGAKRWEFRKHVFVPAHTTKVIPYDIVGEEEQTIQPTIKVVSLASSNIHAEKNVTMVVKSDLIGDYKATNNGALIFPIFETMVYSLAGLISNIFP